nr:hypothetical protein B0A51_14838 [Rachicladosporium sp. CCFEE 5018]
MVLIKWPCAPEDIEATIAVSISTTPSTLSISAMKQEAETLNPVFTINIHARCISGNQPNRAITIKMDGLLFDNTGSGFDTLALGVLSGLVAIDAPEEKRKYISFGMMRPHYAREETSDAICLREWPRAAFLTVPAMSTGEEVVVNYPITVERLFERDQHKGPDYFAPGEKYRTSVHPGYVGCLWWCWGGLDDELKDKKLNIFKKGERTTICAPRRPPDDEIKREKWVLGEDVAHFQFVCEGSDRSCEIMIVE